MPTIWFAGVCDSLLHRVQVWGEKYELGTIYATRKFLTKSFEHHDVPVQYVHNVPFSLAEMTHLVRILTAERPKWSLTADFTRYLGIMQNPALMRMYSKVKGGMLEIGSLACRGTWAGKDTIHRKVSLNWDGAH